MANRKISDLTSLTAPATGDLLPIVDISEAAAADKNKKITYAELLASAPAGSAAAASFSFDADPNTGIFNPAADTLAFAEGGAEAMRIDSSGRLLVGLTAANTSGGILQVSSGLTFPANVVASADPNTLDDYEEGTFIPTIIGSSTAGTATYATRASDYVKIGKQVTFTTYIDWSAGTGTGNLQVSGLPFTVGSNYASVCIGYIDRVTFPALSIATAVAWASTTRIDFYSQATGGGNVAAITYDGVGGFMLTGTYFTA